MLATMAKTGRLSPTAAKNVTKATTTAGKPNAAPMAIVSSHAARRPTPCTLSREARSAKLTTP